MLFASKKVLLACAAMAFVLAMLGLKPARAQDASDRPRPAVRVTGPLLDRIETQIDGLKNKLTIHGQDDSQEQMAQGYGRPPVAVGGGDAYGGDGVEDAAGLEVRVSRIEEQMRQLTGQIEQLQFGQRKLEEQMRKFQQDVDFRFQDNHGGGAAAPRPLPQKRSEGDGIIEEPKPAVAQAQTAPVDTGPMNLRSSRRGDAFDPASDPNAPGAPRPLGSIASGSTALPPPPAAKTQIAEAEMDPNAPLDLSSGRRSSVSTPTATPAATTPSPGFGTQASPRQIPLTQAAPAQPANNGPSTQVAAVPPITSPREEFDSALTSLKQKEYETAEKGFSTFLQKNPKNPRTADALYYLGESYFNRDRKREAAEQYLKISTDYSKSARAPEALLRLGQSLNAIGAKEQACASFNKISSDYPNASAWVKSGAERESKRSQC